MYTYYALKTKRVDVPRWIAMVVTCVQTTQMLLGVFLSIFVVKTRYGWKCQQSLANAYLTFFLYGTFAFFGFLLQGLFEAKATKEKEGLNKPTTTIFCYKKSQN